eukprot:XP_027317407.1 growth factor receptor-bound protein 14 [Anas platyrhynchos]
MAAPLPAVPPGPRGEVRSPGRHPPPPPPPDRRTKKDDSVLEIPSIPNPFPELCCSPFASVLSVSLLPKATSRKKQVRFLNYYLTNTKLCVSDIFFQMFLSSSTYPEIHGYLHAKEQGKKSWKKLFFLLRRSGLYFSTKGTSKEPRHLQFFCEFSNSDMYMSLTGKKISGAPTNYGFCFKPNKSGGTRDLKQLCADDEQSRTCWMTAIRLLKYGMQLYQNYMQPYQGRSGCSPLNITPMRSISENSLVAMDFSGHRSRIIENPMEVLSVAVEEGLAWRRRGCLRLNSHGSPIAMSNMAIHRSQSWFHHKISRDEAQRLILQHGLVDGVFLVRDSQSNPKTFVLSLSHGLKIKHFQIVPLEDDGKLFYTLDDGQTRFTDLIQLVEFYQLNKGVLPCKLKHYCARIAL